MKHTITVLVENQPGVLARIVGLISGRGFNIDSLNVGPTQDPTVSRMTIQVLGDDRVLEQVNKQLNKLVDVIKVSDLTGKSFIDRELILARIAVPAERRSEFNELVQMLKATIVAVQHKSVIVQITGDQHENQEFLTMMKPFKIMDTSRSGVIALARSAPE